MKTVTFSYKKIGGDYLPVIPVAVINEKKFIKVPALVDSGAKYSVFRSDVGYELGIDVHSGKEKTPTVGNGEKITVYLHKVKVVVAGKVIKKAEICFSDDLRTAFNLLGRETIFSEFEISFNDKKKTLKFNPDNQT